MLQAEVARDIIAWFCSEGYRSPTTPDAKYLLIFCLYCWSSFARGYIFEVSILRDLSQSGIEFTPHSLDEQEERFTPYDFTLFNLRGDVKTSLYFLEDLQQKPLKNDFYITRCFNPQNRRYQNIVVMTLLAWLAINGEAVYTTTLSRALQAFPAIARVNVQGETLIVAKYNVWKQKVLLRQQRI